MSDPTDASRNTQELAIDTLSLETREALLNSALRNGRSLHEEAEHIIRTHLAASRDSDD
jgi:hypothetical protein